MTPKFHTLQVSEVRKETEDTVSIRFDLPKEVENDYNYIPGQYLTLRKTINGEDIRRSYSICSSPDEKELRVAVKQIENGKFSTFANSELKAGDSLEVMTPTGNFKHEINTSSSNSYALFAAGSGITPILSILKAILKNEINSDVTLFYGNKGFNSIVFREAIEALKNEYMDRFRIIHILSRENLGGKLQRGRIDATKTENLFSTYLEQTGIDGAYICGPEAMIHGVKDGLIAKNVDSNKIHFELFTTPSEKVEIKEETDSHKVESQVRIILDGENFDLPINSSGENILDTAQNAGADLPFACKGGVCCTCKAKIIEGTAKMDVNYALEKDEVEAGYILTCQAHPTSDKLIISFDD